MLIKSYKINRKTIFYITKDSAGKYHACTGKPSDPACISWIYNTLEEAEATAAEYIENREQLKKAIAHV